MTHWSLREIIAPTEEPITLALAKVHLRIEATDTYFDADITAQIVAARQQVERDTSRFIARATYDFAFDGPAADGLIIVPYAPIAEVSNVTVYNPDDQATLVNAGSYLLDQDSEPPRLVLDTAADDPAFRVQLRDYRGTVVRFIGGPQLMGATYPSPAWSVQAIKLLLEWWRAPKPDPAVKEAYDRLIHLHCLMGIV